MACISLTSDFHATHGSRDKRETAYRLEIKIGGEIIEGFVVGMDYDYAIRMLEETVSSLQGKYLDDVVGRATDENIALYIMNELKSLPLMSVKVVEDDKRFVEVFPTDFDEVRYPSVLEFNKGQSLLLREMPDQAIEHLDNATEIDPEFAEAFNLRGRCQKYLDRYDLAMLDYFRALMIDPEYGEAYRNLGNAYYYLDMTDQMIPVFTKAVELIPDSALAYNNRGFAYQKIGEFELALADHDKAIELDPSYAEAYLDRSNAHKALGHGTLAENDFMVFKQLTDSGADTYSGIGMH